jgi:hypothetical protein
VWSSGETVGAVDKRSSVVVEEPATGDASPAIRGHLLAGHETELIGRERHITSALSSGVPKRPTGAHHDQRGSRWTDSS